MAVEFAQHRSAPGAEVLDAVVAGVGHIHVAYIPRGDFVDGHSFGTAQIPWSSTGAAER